MKNTNNTYWIRPTRYHVPKPPLKSMSYDEASQWIRNQPAGVQIYYTIELSCLGASK